MIVAALQRLGLASLMALIMTQGPACGDKMRGFDDVNDPSDDRALRDCRYQGRAALDGGSSAHRAYDVYETCTRDAGLR